MIDLNSIFWADSNIEKITIEYNCAQLYVFNSALQRNLRLNCTGFIGLTNLCIWDDQIIEDAEFHQVSEDENTPFLQMLFSAYDKNFNYGERWLNQGILEVRIKLVNGITFSIYCQKVDVEEAK